MRHRSHQSPRERAARSAIMKLIGQRQPLLTASLVSMKRACGKTRCRCARGDYKHVSMYLAIRAHDKRKMIYVPGDLEEKVRQWVGDGQEAVKLLGAISQASLEVLLKEKKALRSSREGRRK